jgi:DNA-directed RNA polymerase subunit beta
MNYSFTEKKRIRKDFGTSQAILDVPNLLQTQIRSYAEFLQLETKANERRERGLHGALKSVFPIVSYSRNAALEYVSYKLGNPPFNVRECKLRGMTYAAPLRVKVRLVIYDKESKKNNRTIRDVREQEVYLGNLKL